MAKTGRTSDQFMLRMPDGLRDRIKEAAAKNGRSMTAEIVATLEGSYPDPAQFLEEIRFLDEIDEIQAKLDRIRSVRLAEVEAGRKEVRETERLVKKSDELLKKPKK